MEFTPPLEDDLMFEDDTGNVEDEVDIQRRSTTSAVELEELLKKKDFTRFRAKLNLPTDLAERNDQPEEGTLQELV